MGNAVTARLKREERVAGWQCANRAEWTAVRKLQGRMRGGNWVYMAA